MQSSMNLATVCFSCIRFVFYAYLLFVMFDLVVPFAPSDTLHL
jgi:hypothetical protein